jgi:hypothetical protein
VRTATDPTSGKPTVSHNKTRTTRRSEAVLTETPLKNPA